MNKKIIILIIFLIIVIVGILMYYFWHKYSLDKPITITDDLEITLEHWGSYVLYRSIFKIKSDGSTYYYLKNEDHPPIEKFGKISPEELKEIINVFNKNKKFFKLQKRYDTSNMTDGASDKITFYSDGKSYSVISYDGSAPKEFHNILKVLKETQKKFIETAI